MLEGRVTSEVQEAPFFSITDPTDDAGQGAELDVDDHLDVCVSSGVLNNSGFQCPQIMLRH